MWKKEERGREEEDKVGWEKRRGGEEGMERERERETGLSSLHCWFLMMVSAMTTSNWRGVRRKSNDGDGV